MKSSCFYFAFILFVLPVLALAHPGGTDSSGCHTCRTNCPNWGLSGGEYHCHNAKALPQPEDPVRSHYGEDGTGTTEPWPEYEAPKPIEVSKPIEIPALAPIVVDPIIEEPATEETVATPETSLPTEESVVSTPKTFWIIRFLRFIF